MTMMTIKKTNNEVSRRSLILLAATLPVFGSAFITNTEGVYYSLSANVIVACIVCYFTDRVLFPTVIFFCLVVISKPLNVMFAQALGFSFAGAYYFIPCAVFAFLLAVTSWKKTITWWRKDEFDSVSLWMIFLLAIASAIALYVWFKYHPESSAFISQLPDGPWYTILSGGVAFAGVNAMIEEFLSRGMLCNGLEKIFTSRVLIIVIQSTFFGCLHYSGFPGGVTGIVMVFVWSFALGVIRYRTLGLGGVMISHFFSDLTIYVLLYSLK